MIMEIQGGGPTILPILYGRVDSDQVPLDILGLRWIRFASAKGRAYDKALLSLLKALNLKRPSREVSLAEIREKQTIFVREHLAGTLNYDVFWAFWNKPMAAGNWDKLLYLVKENISQGRLEEAAVNVEILHGMLQMYQISTETPPKMLRDMLCLATVREHGLLLGRLLQLTNAFRVLVDSDLIISLLSSPSAHAVHATSEYIDQTGVEIDDAIADALLKVVESSDDQRYYFSGQDSDGQPMVVDARQAAAVALMLADPPGISRQAIIERVKKHYPKVVAQIGQISLRAMVNSSFGGSHRKSISAEGWSMEDALGEVLKFNHENPRPKKRLRKTV